MARTNGSRPTEGARIAPPEEEANPTPPVGSKPEEETKPDNPKVAEVKPKPPAALRKNEPRPGAETITVETTGPFMIVDPGTLHSVPHDGPAEVEKTTFIESAIEDGRLKEA